MNFIRSNSRSGFSEEHVSPTPTHSAAPPPPDDDVQREHVFDKVVTPSDVGKLNRLVIPKQHAERYFPLDSSSSGDRAGLLLTFEECRTGKLWRFRYSYWNSSQSYVMTKGWSRFVKEKSLDAGDIVSFHRSTLAAPPPDRRLFIDWRHRPPDAPPIIPNYHFPFHRPSVHPWTPLLIHPPPAHFLQASAGYCYSNRNRLPSPPAQPQVVFDAVPVVQRRRLRLFGVNMDCAISESDDFYPQSTPLHSTTMFLLPSSNHGEEEDDDKDKGSISLELDM